MKPWDPDTEAAADYSPAVCADIVRRAMGTDAYPFAIRTIRIWTMTAQVAERYRERRVFLADDELDRRRSRGEGRLRGGRGRKGGHRRGGDRGRAGS